MASPSKWWPEPAGSDARPLPDFQAQLLLLAATPDRYGGVRIDRRIANHPRELGGAFDRRAVPRQDDVPGLEPQFRRRRIGHHLHDVDSARLLESRRLRPLLAD